jgi:hypothetical protein
MKLLSELGARGEIRETERNTGVGLLEEMGAGQKNLTRAVIGLSNHG